MTYRKGPSHPAPRFLGFVALLMAFGLMMEGFNRAHSYFASSQTAEQTTTEGRG